MTDATYGPEVTFDLPAADDRARGLLDAAEIDHGDTQHYRIGPVSDAVQTALEAAIARATKGFVPLEQFDLHTITHDSARVEITGSFQHPTPASNFESFASEQGESA